MAEHDWWLDAEIGRLGWPIQFIPRGGWQVGARGIQKFLRVREFDM